MNLPFLESKVDTIKKDLGRRKGIVNDITWDRLVVSPTCPPSTNIVIRGGLVYAAYQQEWWLWDGYWEQTERAYTVPDLTASISTYTRYAVDAGLEWYAVEESVTFSNSLFYKSFVVVLNLPAVVENPDMNDWTIQLVGTNEEFETPGEAEAHMEWDTMVGMRPWQDDDAEPNFRGFPLCGAILRNDGIAGDGHVLPIDRLNRGRSYLWPKDLRPRWLIYR